MNWIKYLFYDDWYPVWVERCVWEITTKGEIVKEEYCWYEILYSPYKNKYKLKIGGYDPKSHGFYKKVVIKLNNYINGNEILINNKILK